MVSYVFLSQDKPRPLMALFLTDQICYSFICTWSPSDIFCHFTSILTIGFKEGSNVLTDQIHFNFFVGNLVYTGFIEGSKVLTDRINFSFLEEGHLVYNGFIEGSKALTDQIHFSFLEEGHLVYIGFIEVSKVLTDQIHFNFFVEGHLVTISTKSFLILNIGFRGEDVYVHIHKRNWPCPLVAILF